MKILIAMSFFCLINSLLFCQDCVGNEHISYVEFRDDLFLEKIDSIYQYDNIVISKQKGYLYLHSPTVNNVENDCSDIIVDVGWRDESPNELLKFSKKNFCVTWFNSRLILMEESVLYYISHRKIGAIKLHEEYLDEVIYPRQELIATNAKGDTIIFDPSWRPTSVYIHPATQIQFQICK